LAGAKNVVIVSVAAVCAFALHFTTALAAAIAAVVASKFRRCAKRKGALLGATPCRTPMHPLKSLASAVNEAGVTSLECACRTAQAAEWPAVVRQDRPICLAVFPGSFNPPSRVHVEIAQRVNALPGVDAVWLDMTIHRTHKQYVDTVLDHRLHMAEAAVAHLSNVGVTQLQACMGEEGWGLEYFKALRVLLGGPQTQDHQSMVRISWVLGSDVLQGMRWWAAKASALIRQCDQLIVFARCHADADVLAMVEDILGIPLADAEANGLTVTVMNFEDTELEEASSSMIRRYLVSLYRLVPLPVLQYIVNHKQLIEFYNSLYKERDVQASMAVAREALAKVKSVPDLCDGKRH